MQKYNCWLEAHFIVYDNRESEEGTGKGEGWKAGIAENVGQFDMGW